MTNASPPAKQAKPDANTSGLEKSVSSVVPMVAALVDHSAGLFLVGEGAMIDLPMDRIMPGERPSETALRVVRDQLGLCGRVVRETGTYPDGERLVFAYWVEAEVESKATPPDGRMLTATAGESALNQLQGISQTALSDWLDLSTSVKSRSQPVMSALDLFSKRHVLRILWELQRAGPLGFNELRRACANLSPDTLSTRVNELKERGMIDGGGKLPLELTKRAKAIAPQLLELTDWARKAGF